MGLKLLPFRQYDEHDVVNLYRYADGMVLDNLTGAGSGDAGTFVVISAGDFSLDPVSYASDSYLGKTDYPYVGVAQYPKVNLQLGPTTSGNSCFGITLLQCAKHDENGEKLLYYPQKALEHEAVLPGQAVPVATRGVFTIFEDAFDGSATDYTIGGDFTYSYTNKGKITGAAAGDTVWGQVIGTGSRTTQNGETDQFDGDYLVIKLG